MQSAIDSVRGGIDDAGGPAKQARVAPPAPEEPAAASQQQLPPRHGLAAGSGPALSPPTVGQLPPAAPQAAASSSPPSVPPAAAVSQTAERMARLTENQQRMVSAFLNGYQLSLETINSHDADGWNVMHHAVEDH